MWTVPSLGQVVLCPLRKQSELLPRPLFLFLPHLSSMVDCDKKMKQNKPFTLQVAFGHGASSQGKNKQTKTLRQPFTNT